nr:MAG: hypothetical protein DIU52_00170 [bacterium]
MHGPRIARQRLRNQRLAGPPFASPEEVLRWLSASQAQEYGLAKWSLAQRTRRHSDAAVERALADGRILRTHVLRPTWHFVLPEDILLAAGADRAAGAAHERVGLPPARAGRRGAGGSGAAGAASRA